MIPETKKIVLLPRVSSFVGDRAFTTSPVSVREFSSANLTVWMGNFLGSAPGLTISVETSRDLENWEVAQSFSAGANSEETKLASFDMEWMRVSVGVSGADTAVNCWVVGDFYPRARSSV